MNKIGVVGNLLMIILALPGIFFFSIIVHEVTHIFQSNGADSFNYDMQQASFAHIKHDLSQWDSNEDFVEFVETTENSADKIESFAGHGSAALIGTAFGFILWRRKKE